MANNGSFNTGNYDGRYLRFSWSVKEQSIEDNTTTISWELKSDGGAYTYWYMSGNFKVVIDNDVVYQSATRIRLDKDQVVASGTKTITHTSNGSRSFTASAEAGIYYVAVNCKGSGSWELPAIPRAADITYLPTQFTDEDTSIRIAYINNANASIQIGVFETDGTTQIIQYRTVSKEDGTHTFSFSSTEQTALRKSVKTGYSKTVRFYIKTTLDGKTYKNYKTTTLKLVDYKPTITTTITDINETTKALTGLPAKLVKYHSTAEYTITATPRKEATIKETSVKNGSTTKTTATGSFKKVSNNKFTFYAEDNRGNSTSTTIDQGMVAYRHLTCTIKPTITLVGESKISISFYASGECFTGSFGAVDNSLTAVYELYSGKTYITGGNITVTPRFSDNKYSFTQPINASNLDYKKSYTIRLMISDKLESLDVYSKALKLEPVFDWSGEDFAVNVPMSIEKQPLADFVIETGESDGWTYRKWKSGRAECWKTVEVKTPIAQAWGAMYVGTTKMSRQTYPFNFANKPVEVATLQNGYYATWLYAMGNGDGVNGASASAIYNVCRPTAVSTTETFYINLYVTG